MRRKFHVRFGGRGGLQGPSLPLRLSRSVRRKGGDTFHINLCDTDDKDGAVMTVRK